MNDVQRFQQIPNSFEVVKNAYEQALIRENIILSRAEKDRLLSEIMKMVLDDMSKKLK